MKKKIIIGLVALILVGLISYSIYYWSQENKKKQQEKRQEEAKEELIRNTEEQIGGEIIKEGFNITYESGKERFIITITNDPFENNKERALNYLNEMGLDICNINYLVLPGHGVTIAGAKIDNSCGIDE